MQHKEQKMDDKGYKIAMEAFKRQRFNISTHLMFNITSRVRVGVPDWKNMQLLPCKTVAKPGEPIPNAIAAIRKMAIIPNMHACEQTDIYVGAWFDGQKAFEGKIKNERILEGSTRVSYRFCCSYACLEELVNRYTRPCMNEHKGSIYCLGCQGKYEGNNYVPLISIDTHQRAEFYNVYVCPDSFDIGTGGNHPELGSITHVPTVIGFVCSPVCGERVLAVWEHEYPGRAWFNTTPLHVFPSEQEYLEMNGLLEEGDTDK